MSDPYDSREEAEVAGRRRARELGHEPGGFDVQPGAPPDVWNANCARGCRGYVIVVRDIEGFYRYGGTATERKCKGKV